MKRKIQVHTKINGTYFLINIKEFKQNLQKSEISYQTSQPISHILAILRLISALYFTPTKNNIYTTTRSSTQ